MRCCMYFDSINPVYDQERSVSWLFEIFSKFVFFRVANLPVGKGDPRPGDPLRLPLTQRKPQWHVIVLSHRMTTLDKGSKFSTRNEIVTK